MGLITAARYEAMRRRERAGETGVFFAGEAVATGSGFGAKEMPPSLLEDAMERHPVLTPRVRRRT
jgi:hypothetical protein